MAWSRQATPPAKWSKPPGAHVINLVNNFFHERLTAVPTIHECMTQHQAEP